jgi:hypothetical protein
MVKNKKKAGRKILQANGVERLYNSSFSFKNTQIIIFLNYF